MFTSISINNFRCFEELSIESLDRVNLIAGKNNVGKTALLEAILMLAYGPNIIVAVRALANVRGIPRVNQAAGGELVFSSLFLLFNNKRNVEISGMLEAYGEQTIKLRIVSSDSINLPLFYNSDEFNELNYNQGLSNQETSSVLQLDCINKWGRSSSRLWVEGQKLRSENPAREIPFKVNFLISNARQSFELAAEEFGRLELLNKQDDLLQSLKVVEPRLRRLATIVVAGTPIIHGDIGLNRMIPLYLMGDGLQRLTSILLAIANAPQGIVLIDEIENGIHHSVLTKIWQAVSGAARQFDTQVIATTHSYECIQAAHQAFASSDQYEFRLHRLDRIAEKIRVVTYDQETLEVALKAELEVR